MLVFEDVHWADEATLDVLRVLGRRVAATPSLVVVTYREDEAVVIIRFAACLASSRATVCEHSAHPSLAGRDQPRASIRPS